MDSIVLSSKWLRVVAALAGVVAVNLITGHAQAQTYSWTGNSATGYWATASDWVGNNTPGDGTVGGVGATGALVFDVANLTGSKTLTANQNYGGTTGFKSSDPTATSLFLNYTAGTTGFDLTGSPIYIDGTIDNYAGDNTLGSIGFVASENIEVDSDNLTVNGMATPDGGTITVTKTGNGSLTSVAASTSAAAFTLSTGTVYLAYTGTNGSGGASFYSGLGAGTFTQNGGVLAGTGSVKGAATINSTATLSPGGTYSTTGTSTTNAGVGVAGTLQFDNNLTLGSGSSTNLDIVSATGAAGTANDLINLVGYYSGTGGSTYNKSALTYGGTLNLNFALNPGVATYSLFQLNGGTETGDFSAINLTGSLSGSLADSSGVWTGTSNGDFLTFTDSTGQLAITAAPEPASWILIMLSGLVFVGFLRRRVRNAFLP